MEAKKPATGVTAEEMTEEKRLEQEALDAAESKLVMDFGLGQQAPERITIEVLKQLIRENPKAMTYALRQPIHESITRAAAFLLLVGEEAARLLMNELGEHEKAMLTSSIAELSPVSLEDQKAVLKEFTELFLQANSSVFGNPDFAKNIAAPLPQPTAFEKSETGE